MEGQADPPLPKTLTVAIRIYVCTFCGYLETYLVTDPPIAPKPGTDRDG
jgi:hypothetical protein